MTPTTVAAVDCSLVVENQTGQRPCETLVSRCFGAYNASCHSTNLGMPYAQTGTKLVGALEKLGFLHDFELANAKRRAGQWLFEVYPHPAMVRLFNLTTIIRYKKVRVIEKRQGLANLRQRIAELAGFDANATYRKLMTLDLASLRGKALKNYEDTLDAVFCGYLAWYCWRWGEERNEMFGTLNQGYIVVPAPI